MIIKLKTSINEEELEKISLRTRNALTALRERNYKWIARYTFSKADIERASEKRKEMALQNPNFKRAIGYIFQLRENTDLTFEAIAKKLNKAGFKTSRGKNFAPATVFALLKRAKEYNLEVVE